VTGIRQSKSLAVRNPIFCARLSLRRSHFPLHPRAVALQKGEIESQMRQGRSFQLSFGGPPKQVFRLCQAVKVNKVVGEEVIASVSVRSKVNTLTTLFHGPFISAEHGINEAG